MLAHFTRMFCLASAFTAAGIVTAHGQQTIDTVLLNYNNKCASYCTAIDKEARKGITKIIFFDLDNTLFTINNRGYGSDDWSSLIADSIKAKVDTNYTKLFFNVLYEPVSTVNFRYLPSSPICVQAKDLINEQSKMPGVLIYGLTSRAQDMQIETDSNLYRAGYRFMYRTNDTIKTPSDVQMAHNIIYTKGGNKGKAINSFITTNFPKTNKYDIYYFDDTYKKLADAKGYIDSISKVLPLLDIVDKTRIKYCYLLDERIKPMDTTLATAYWQSFLYMMYNRNCLTPAQVLK